MTSFNEGIEAAADKLKELAASLRKYGYPEKAEVLEEVAIPISALQRPEPSEVDEPVLIWSGEHQAYWRPGGWGYVTDARGAGVWLRSVAEAVTAHCGPEKKIEIRSIRESDFARAALKAMEG